MDQIIQQYANNYVKWASEYLLSCMSDDFYKQYVLNKSGNYYYEAKIMKYKGFFPVRNAYIMEMYQKIVAYFTTGDVPSYAQCAKRFYDLLNQGIMETFTNISPIEGISKNIFFPVGQGLFQASFLFDGFLDVYYDIEKIPGDEYCLSLVLIPHYRLVIYDCGGDKAAMTTSLQLFKTECQKLNISQTTDEKYIAELFVLSHFDEDHWSGLHELVKIVHIKHIMFPYQDAITRAIHVLDDEIDDLASLGEYEDIVAFQMNTVNYLQEKHIGENYFIATDLPSGLSAIRRAKLKDVCTGMDTHDFLRDIDVYVEDETAMNTTNVYQVHIDATDGNISVLNMAQFWQFCFIHYKEVDVTFEARKSELLAKIKTKLGIPMTEKNEEVIAEKITEAICDKDTFPEIKHIYDSVFTSGVKRNIISLCMYFEMKAPFYNYSMSSKRDEKRTSSTSVNLLFVYRVNASQCLLTGDTSFGGKVKTTVGEMTIVQFLYDVLSKYHFYPQLISLPHHGSIKNWKNNNAFFNNERHWVVSYGKNNRHRHPSHDVASLIGVHYMPIYYTKEYSGVVKPFLMGDKEDEKDEPLSPYEIYDYDDPPVSSGMDKLLPGVLYHCNTYSMVIFII